MEVLGIALSGMQSADTKIAVSAHNVANLMTEDFRPQRTVQTSKPGGGSTARVQQSATPKRVSLAREVVGQMQASTQYSASARVFQVGSDMKGQLIDMLG
jgi:flagellar hook protein FlgE